MLESCNILTPDKQGIRVFVKSINGHEDYNFTFLKQIIQENKFPIHSIANFPIEKKQYDLIIIEDEWNNIGPIIKAANSIQINGIQNILVATNAQVASEVFKANFSMPKLITLDFKLGEIANFEKETLALYKQIKRKFKLVPVLGISNFELEKDAKVLVDALREQNDSAYSKSTSFYDVLPNILRDKIAISELREEVKTLRKKLKKVKRLENAFDSIDFGRVKKDPRFTKLKAPLIGSSEKIIETKFHIILAAKTNIKLFIPGESGTGKEVVARAIHELSARKSGPFIKVNLSNISEDQFEESTFGILTENGKQKGFFEQAIGGTLFIDEIETLNMADQQKILKAIDSPYSILPLGGESRDEIDVSDIRIIFASNDGEKLKDKSQFSEELYSRLNIGSFPKIPALRERQQDIDELVKYFCKKLQTKHRRKEELSFAREALGVLKKQTWKGNVKELKFVVEQTIQHFEPHQVAIVESNDIEQIIQNNIYSA